MSHQEALKALAKNKSTYMYKQMSENIGLALR
jgi:hypothetical protein